MFAAALAALLAAAPPAPSPTPSAGARPDLVELGRGIAADYAGGRDGLTPRFDLEGLLDRALAGVEAPAPVKAGFRAGATGSGVPVGRRLLGEVEAGGTVTFRSVGRLDGEEVVRLRMISAGGGFNYLELFTARRGGELRVVDLFDLAEGARFSANVRRLFLMAAGEAERGLLDRLSGRERVLLEHSAEVKRLTAAIGAGRHAEALAVYDALPRELRHEPIFRRQAIYAAMEVDERRYRRALDEYIKAYPGDPAASLMAIDACFMREDWVGARAAIDRVERHVGTDDGWLEVLRGSVARSAGDPAGARRHFEEAARREPGLRQAWGSLLDLALAARDWAGVARALTGLEATGQAIADLTRVEGFEGFVASKEGKAFLARRKAR